MARRIVGLCGRGKGPLIFVGQEVTKLLAEIGGLPPEEFVEVTVHHETGSNTTLVLNGESELVIGHCVEFEYKGGGLPICAVKVA